MENEIIKQAFRLGNSAGVLLPVEWKGRKVAIKLIEKSIPHEIMEILDNEKILKNTIGIFLAGSYARKEETEKSDIDILVVTDAINRQIKKGKYEIILISKDEFEKAVVKDLYIASLVNEAVAILNEDFLNDYKDRAKNIPVKSLLNKIKSMTSINEGFVNLDEELGENVPDETLYSIILRLRELYLMECIKSNRKPSNREFTGIIKKIAGEEAYEAYLRIKNDLKPKKAVTAKEAKNLISEIKKRINKLSNGKKV